MCGGSSFAVLTLSPTVDRLPDSPTSWCGCGYLKALVNLDRSSAVRMGSPRKSIAPSEGGVSSHAQVVTFSQALTLLKQLTESASVGELLDMFQDAFKAR